MRALARRRSQAASKTDPRDRADPCPLRLSALACAAAQRRLGDQSQEGLSPLNGVGPDQLVNGTKIRVVTIVYTFSRCAPAIIPRLRCRAPDILEVLERVGAEIGLSQTIRVDKGSEFVSRDLDLWACQRGVTLDFSQLGKPTDNAFIEVLR